MSIPWRQVFSGFATNFSGPIRLGKIHEGSIPSPALLIFGDAQPRAACGSHGQHEAECVRFGLELCKCDHRGHERR